MGGKFYHFKNNYVFLSQLFDKYTSYISKHENKERKKWLPLSL